MATDKATPAPADQSPVPDDEEGALGADEIERVSGGVRGYDPDQKKEIVGTVPTTK